MFNRRPSYSPYRTLRLSSPMMVGEDIYALQTALAALSHDPGPLDGIFGRATERAVRAAQTDLFVRVDGLAGGDTQLAICRHLAYVVTENWRLPSGLLFGQISHESSCRVGNYSGARPDGSYDAGVTQRNTAHTSARAAFTVPDSMGALGKLLREHFDLYAGVPQRRRWELAAGAWNAPAYANYIAREEGAKGVPARTTARPGVTARATLERYIDSVTSMMAPV
jgi:hypothetical protein